MISASRAAPPLTVQLQPQPSIWRTVLPEMTCQIITFFLGWMCFQCSRTSRQRDLLSGGTLSLWGHPDRLRWCGYRPVTWPVPSQPGVGHLLSFFSPLEESGKNGWKRIRRRRRRRRCSWRVLNRSPAAEWIAHLWLLDFNSPAPPKPPTPPSVSFLTNTARIMNI